MLLFYCVLREIQKKLSRPKWQGGGCEGFWVDWIRPFFLLFRGLWLHFPWFCFIPPFEYAGREGNSLHKAGRSLDSQVRRSGPGAPDTEKQPQILRLAAIAPYDRRAKFWLVVALLAAGFAAGFDPVAGFGGAAGSWLGACAGGWFAGGETGGLWLPGGSGLSLGAGGGAGVGLRLGGAVVGHAFGAWLVGLGAGGFTELSGLAAGACAAGAGLAAAGEGWAASFGAGEAGAAGPVAGGAVGTRAEAAGTVGRRWPVIRRPTGAWTARTGAVGGLPVGVRTRGAGTAGGWPILYRAGAPGAVCGWADWWRAAIAGTRSAWPGWLEWLGPVISSM